MRKTFPLAAPNLKPARVIDSIKSNVRKYFKRERRKELPEGADFWAFDCRAGKDQQSAVETHHAELAGVIDTASKEDWSEIYIEILARPETRTKKSPETKAPEASPESEDPS